MVPIPRRLIELALRQFVPIVLEVGELLSKNAEANGLPPRINWWIATYGVNGWAKMYLSTSALAEAHSAGFAADASIPLGNIDWSGIDLTNPDAIYAAIWHSFEDLLQSGSLEPDLPDSIESEEQMLYAMPPEARKAHDERMRLLVSAALVIVNNYFACMTYKKSMLQLVEEALKGNRKSFLRAVHVDSSCLENMDYFRETVQKAALSPSDTFASKVQRWRKKPPLASAVTLSGFYVVCMFLSLLGVLDQFKADLGRFAELCQSLGVYGPPPEEDVVDVESFAKAIRRFESEHQVMSFLPPGKLIVKDTF